MERFNILSTDGKTELACYRNPCKNPRALVQISHGMCEYFERYTGFAEYLGEQGFLVFGHDHVGHGHTAKTEENLGFSHGAEVWVEDVFALSKKMKEDYPDLPLLLFGHSMGSFIAREVLARHGESYAGAVICGTGGPDMPTGAGKLLAKLLMKFRGEHHRSEFLKKIGFSGYLKKYPSVKTPVDWLTRDETVVERYLHDPFCNYTFTVKAYYDLFDVVGKVSEKGWAARVPNIPLMVVSGELDPVGSWGKGVRKVAERLKATGHNVTLRLYPDMRHEILNEVGHEEVWKEIALWMKIFLE